MQNVLVVDAGGAVHPIGIGRFAPAEDLAARDIVFDVAITGQQVIALAAFQIVVTRAAENLVVARATVHGVVAIARIDDVVITKLARQGRVAAIHAVAIAIRAGRRCDQVVGIVAFDDAWSKVRSVNTHCLLLTKGPSPDPAAHAD